MSSVGLAATTQAGPKMSGRSGPSRQGSAPAHAQPGTGSGKLQAFPATRSLLSVPGSSGVSGWEQPAPLTGLLVCLGGPESVRLHQSPSEPQPAALGRF